jgi:hypothetical protein
MADNQYLDIISFRPRGGKPFAHKIGSAKSNGKGGFNCYFDSLPLPDKDGKVTLLISPRQEKAEYGKRETPARGGNEEFDDAPF